MKIIIIGCGKVGYTLVEQLSGDGHDLVVVDENPNQVKHLTDDLDAMGIVGNGLSYQTLQDADVKHADLVIAVTGSDEQNLLCCVIAKKASHCHTIARVRNPIFNKQADFLREEFDLAMIINPEYAAACEIARIFQFPSAIKIDTFSRGHMEMYHFRLGKNSPLIDQKVLTIRASMHCDVLVSIVTRGDEVIIPNGNFIFQEGDTVAFISNPKNAHEFFRKLNVETNPVKNAMIVGGGKIAYYLTERLIDNGIRTTIIETSRERCDFLSDRLPKATIINGDGTDQKLLLQEGLSNVDGFAALTGMDEENILLSLYAKGVTELKAVTKINRIKFTNVINSLSLDSIIYPRLITADLITKYVRSMNNSKDSNVETFYRLEDGRAEALEFIIHDASPVVNVPLQEMKLRKNILIGCLSRKGKLIIPGGQDSIQIGDSVVIIMLNDYRISDITDILEN